MSNEEYTSPLSDELDHKTDTFGTNIIVAYDKKNKRLLLDVPMGERLKISSSGKSMLLANGKYDLDQEKGGIQMNINVWDNQFTKAELPKVKEFLEVKQQQANYKQQLADLQNA